MNAWSLKTTTRSLASSWREFFHAPCDARTCAVVRIVYALLVLVYLAVLYPDLDRWFTAGGVLHAAASREMVSPHAWSLLWLLPDNSATVHRCFWLAVAHALLLLVGLLPRLNALGLFVWFVSFQMRNPAILDGEDNAFRLLAFFLIWMPIGQCWSVNALLSHSGRSKAAGEDAYAAPGFGLRLLQVQMALIFLSTGLVKLSGETWIDGTALYYVSRLDDMFGRLPVPAWMFDTPWVVALLTWSVVVVELAVPLLIWFRETRLPCLALVLLFHLANEWTMHLFLFHWIMLCGWLAFLAPDDFRWLRFSARLPTPDS